jgi:hypothetical protein
MGFFILCLCMSMAWISDTASAAAAAGCTTPTFDFPNRYETGAKYPSSITSADFNGDGVLDLAVLGMHPIGYGKLTLLYGDGEGGIASTATFNDMGHTLFASSVAAGDFDGDGRADVVITHGNSQLGNATAFLYANGFQVQIPLRWPGLGERETAREAIAADFNADGKSDVALTTWGNSGEVLIALGGTGGRFTDFRTFGTGSDPSHLVAQDFNGDGKLDLAVTHSLGGTVAILAGGAGNFRYAIGTRPSSIAAGDFNADNKIDLAVQLETHTEAGRLGLQDFAVLLGNGAGTFAAASTFSSGSEIANLVAVDFNGDGKADIGMLDTKGSIKILLSDGAGKFNLSTRIDSGVANATLIAPDMNADGKPDLALEGNSFQEAAVFLNACGATVSRLDFAPYSFSSRDAYSASEGQTASITVNRNGSLAGAVTVDYATSDGTESNKAVSPSDYKATSGTLRFADGEASKTFTIELANDSENELNEKFLVTLSNPTGSAVLGLGDVAAVRIVDSDLPLTFTVGNASVTEGEDYATVTVTRTNDSSVVGSLDYYTRDGDTFTVGCADATSNSGGAYARCDFATTFGRLDFAAGETQKTIKIPIIDDGHKEGPETFTIKVSNVAETPTTHEGTVTIQDNDAESRPNPIFTTPFFVRQHYFDFLLREPEQGEPWTAVLNKCPDVNNDPSCDRITVSHSFFRSPEFQLKGGYVFRLYKVAYNRLPTYPDLISYIRFVTPVSEAEVYARKAELANSFTSQYEFKATYLSLANSHFVPALLSRYQLTQITTPDPAQPDGMTKVTLTQADLVNQLNTRALTHAQVLRAIADSDEVKEREFNNAFVAMQYYGYLRRTPDAAGYEAWLGVLRRGDIRTMVNGFMNSAEYKLRFGGL